MPEQTEHTAATKGKTDGLDALFGDEALREAQRREANELAELGIDWASERW